jgi:hypothetical protein
MCSATGSYVPSLSSSPPGCAEHGRQRRRTNESNFCDLLSAPLHSENLSVVRHVDPATGFVFTQYVDGSDQAVARLSTTYSLQKADAGFIPPPT